MSKSEEGNAFRCHPSNSFRYITILVPSKEWVIHTTLLRLLVKGAAKTASPTDTAEHIRVYMNRVCLVPII